MTRIGVVREIVRYPVKSMAGLSIDSTALGWHGIAGDRRFAFRRAGDGGGFPWLTASRLPELLLYRPAGHDESAGEPLPTHVQTPAGSQLELASRTLREEIGTRAGYDVEMMHLRNGVFDDASVSVISTTTIDGICHDAGVRPDGRRFRANLILETDEAKEFAEDSWIGGTLRFGTAGAVEVAVTAADVRCMMINLDPDTAKQDASVLRSVVRRNDNRAGVYGTATRTGELHVGQEVFFQPARPSG